MSENGENPPNVANLNSSGKTVTEQPSIATTSTSAVESIVAILSNETFMGMLADKLSERSEKASSEILSRKTTPDDTTATENDDENCDTSKQVQLKMPNFILPQLDSSDRLYGHKNFRDWKSRVERDITAMGRLDFLMKSFGGNDSPFPSTARKMYNAQVLQYLEATLNAGPKALMTNETDASVVYAKLIKTYGKTDLQKQVDLWDSWGRLNYQYRSNPTRFVNEFEVHLDDFRKLGIVFLEKTIVGLFLHKMRVRLDTNSPFTGFYSTISTLPDELKTFEYVKNTFLDIANGIYDRQQHDNAGKYEVKRKNCGIVSNIEVNDENSTPRINCSNCGLDDLVEDIMTFCDRCSSCHALELTSTVDQVTVHFSSDEESVNSVSDECEKQSMIIYRTVTVPGKRKHDSGNATVNGDKKRNRFGDNTSNVTTKTSQSGARKDGDKGGSKPGSSKFENRNNSDQRKGKSTSLQSRYTYEQLQQLKSMTPADKKSAQCRKCGELFHTAIECKNGGRVCYFCGKMGHEKKECPEYKKKEGKLNVDISKFVHLSTFLVDSGANYHVVGNREALENFCEFSTPQRAKTAQKDSNLFSVGEGNLPILVQFGKFSHILVLRKVQLVLNVDENVLSVKAFNSQFKTLITFNDKSGYISSRKLKKKSLLHIRDGLYRLTAKTTVPMKTNFNEPHKTVLLNTIGNDINDHSNRVIENSCVPVVDKYKNKESSVQLHKVVKTVSLKTCTTRRQRRNARKNLTRAQLKALEREGEIWHKRMGHISSSYLAKLPQVTTGVGDLSCELTKANCEICAKSKMTRKACTKDRERATRPCQLLHSDLLTISPPTFSQKNKYVLVLVDDYSRYSQLFIMKSKTEVPKLLKVGLHVLKSVSPHMCFQTLRCDSGTEFLGQETLSVLQEFGIALQCSEPNLHQHNGTAERFNRTIQERARALLFQSGFPATFWGLAFQAACYIYNRTPHYAIDFLTPNEKLFGKIPDLGYLKLFGARAFVKVENVPKGKKMDSRSTKMYVAGYTETGYTLYDPKTKKTIQSSNVLIDESVTYKCETSENLVEDSSFTVVSPECDLCENGNESVNTSVGISNGPSTSTELPTVSRSSDAGVSQVNNESQKSDLFGEIEKVIEIDIDWDDTAVDDTTDPAVNPLNIYKCALNPYTYVCDNNIYAADNIPQSYSEAITCKDKSKWQVAIQSELQSLAQHQVWKLVPYTEDIKPIPLKWIFNVKSDGTYKARLVVVGCRDPEKYAPEDLASPTPSPLVTKWFLAISARFKWHLEQIDIKTAFLYSDIDRDKYVCVPDGIPQDRTKFVCKLQKALYGLATAPRCWFQTIDKFLVNECGFERNLREPCVFVKRSNSKVEVLVLLYVDDMLLQGPQKESVLAVIMKLQTHFEVKALGFPTKFLGLEIKACDTGLFVHQTSYTESALKELHMDSSRPVDTPMVPQSKNVRPTCESDVAYSFKKAVGTLLYLAVFSRPDVAFAVNYLARFQANPQTEHWMLIKRICRYLRGTSSYGLMFLCQETAHPIQCYVDSDFAGDIKSTKSTTGFLLFVYGCPVHWCSRLQSIVAQSSAEAEFMAISHAASEIMFLAQLMEETIMISSYPVPMYEDNMAARQNCLTSTSKSRLKHLKRKYLLIKTYVSNKYIDVIKIGTKQQLADILTKALLVNTFRLLRDQIVTKLE